MSRYFVRFANEGDREQVPQALAAGLPAANAPYAARRDSHLLIADLGPIEVDSAREAGAEVFEDVLFQPVMASPIQPAALSDSWRYWEEYGAVAAAAPARVQTQADVMQHINAPGAWEHATGRDVTIAIVDTGISSVRAEFPASKRSPHSISPSYPDGPWNDPEGHGSMCASAAAATTSDGGRWNGVAPGATLLAARTTLWSTDIYKIYDHLIDNYEAGNFEHGLVISNSYGLYQCGPPPGLQQDHPYLAVVREAFGAGIPVVFAAGNNHWDVLCDHDPAACEPNTIWSVNSVDEVITVGTVNQNDSNQEPTKHANSSRGPGQWSNRTKPDVVAPTYGEIVWGDGYRPMEWWGTSGACPQVAGLAALLLECAPSLDPSAILGIIADTAAGLPAAPTCVGAGRIDCAAAVAAARSERRS